MLEILFELAGLDTKNSRQDYELFLATKNHPLRDKLLQTAGVDVVKMNLIERAMAELNKPQLRDIVLDDKLDWPMRPRVTL